MLIDTRDLSADSVTTTDLCIVGAGAAGITIANELSGSGHQVVVLESGGLEPDPATQALYEGALVGAPLLSHGRELSLDQVRLRYLGGTTNHWAGFCRPLEESDFETRPWLEVSGWPFPRADLDPYYARAAEVLRLVGPRFDLPWWQENHDVGEPLLDTDLVATSMFQIQFPFSFGAAYRDALDQASDVDVYLWANATHLRMAPDGSRLDAVEARTLEGRGLTVEADAYVVALGGIETPRLLLASNDVRSAGIGNDHDLVGRYFAEHLQVAAGFAVLNRPPGELQLYGGHEVAAPRPEAPDNQVGAKGVLTLTRRALMEHRLLGLEAQLLVDDPRPGSPEYVNGLRTDDVGPLLEAVEVAAYQSTASIQVLGEQKPNPDSRVRLGPDVDELGMPRVELDWRHSEEDRASIIRGLAIVGNELGRHGLGRLQIVAGGVRVGHRVPEGGPLSDYQVSVDDVDLDDFPLGIGFHHLGTTRMDSDPSRGVVDADGRLHSVANLFIAGSSTFSTSGTASPTFTITALALRLADHLRTAVLGR